MKPAPVTLLDYYATDLRFSANREFVVGQDIEYHDSDFKATPSLQPSPTESEPRRWQVTLDVSHEPPKGRNFPYGYQVVVVGFFRVESSVAAENEERFARIQGASVLYGIAREIVRAVTGRGPHRPVLVPTVSFYDPAPKQPTSGK